MRKIQFEVLYKDTKTYPVLFYSLPFYKYQAFKAFLVHRFPKDLLKQEIIKGKILQFSPGPS